MDAGPASSGEWIYFVVVLVIVGGVLAAYVVAERWYRNPATGLRRRPKGRRARGPLKSDRP